MPDTIAYYEPLNGKPPIVERVEACRPTRDGVPLVCRMTNYWWLDDKGNFGNMTATFVPALTRQAAEDWAREWCRIAYVGFGTAKQKPTTLIASKVLFAPDHTACNAAAHALADLLEADDG